jgi:hypothetical protein
MWMAPQSRCARPALTPKFAVYPAEWATSARVFQRTQISLGEVIVRVDLFVAASQTSN